MTENLYSVQNSSDLSLQDNSQEYAKLYMNELMNNVLPFWIKHSPDKEYGGYFTCLNRDGSVFDTDKFLWLQGRQVWCFSTMYNNIEQRTDWLEMARLGAGFMEKYGRDPSGNWYFSLTRDGSPLVQPYNIFSDCFAAMAFGALDKAIPGHGYSDIALNTFENIMRRYSNPKGIYNKEYPASRPLKNFSLPMILCNLALELEHLLGQERVNSILNNAVHEVMNIFYQPSLGLIVENVSTDGRMIDSFEGRLQNPGHAIEAMWFIMDIGVRFGDKTLIQKAIDIAIKEIEYGWDTDHGGIFYFIDRLGHPPQQLEWDQKLWWVHVESLIAMAKGFALTKDKRCAQWFDKLHKYSWEHFRDPEYGEWFGYLNREGRTLLSLKGGKWKGCFHVPRALYQISKSLSEIIA